MGIVLLFAIAIILLVYAIRVNSNTKNDENKAWVPQKAEVLKTKPAHKRKMIKNYPIPTLKEKKKDLRLTYEKKEALRQAAKVFDWNMYNDIMDGIYTGPWPEQIVGGYYTSLYPNIMTLNIAGINYRTGIDDLASLYFDATLIPEPTNEHDPNAIRVECSEDNRHIGYIPSDATQQVREWIGNNFPYQCYAHIEKSEEWDKTTYLYGHVNIHRPNVSPYQNYNSSKCL